jgi:ubiquinone/menaquinone biosynthesis C-methylase UbiE
MSLRQSGEQNLEARALSEREKALYKASQIFELKVVSHFTNLNDALDVGTGSGYTAFTLTKHFKNVVSIDSDEKCLKNAEKQVLEKSVDNIRLLSMDAHGLTFPDESFDVVTCRAAIHHFEDARKVLAETHRVLRQDGFFILMDFCFSEISKGPLAALSRIREDDFRRYYTFHEYCDLLEGCGFSIDTVYTYTLPRFIREWAAAAPVDIQERIVNAFLNLDEHIHSELRLTQQDDQFVMTYRILEVVCQKS